MMIWGRKNGLADILHPDSDMKENKMSATNAQQLCWNTGTIILSLKIPQEENRR